MIESKKYFMAKEARKNGYVAITVTDPGTDSKTYANS